MNANATHADPQLFERIERHMRDALTRGREGVRQGQSPFAAAIMDDQGQTLAVEHNQVGELKDPSAHGEVMAIRAAARAIGRADLSGCWLISTCEPCPMCASATVLAGIRHVAYGSSVETASRAGYATLQLPSKRIFDHAPVRMATMPSVLIGECDEFLTSNPGSSSAPQQG